MQIARAVLASVVINTRAREEDAQRLPCRGSQQLEGQKNKRRRATNGWKSQASTSAGYDQAQDRFVTAQFDGRKALTSRPEAPRLIQLHSGGATTRAPLPRLNTRARPGSAQESALPKSLIYLKSQHRMSHRAVAAPLPSTNLAGTSTFMRTPACSLGFTLPSGRTSHRTSPVLRTNLSLHSPAYGERRGCVRPRGVLAADVQLVLSMLGQATVAWHLLTTLLPTLQETCYAFSLAFRVLHVAPHSDPELEQPNAPGKPLPANCIGTGIKLGLDS